MRRSRIVLAASVAVCTAALTAAAGSQHEREDLQAQNPPASGIHWAKGRGPAPRARTRRSPDLIYHGGPVMTGGAYVEPIFWGAEWANASFAGDKMTGIHMFYAGMGGSAYEATTNEYTDAAGLHVGTTVAVAPSHVDLSTAPRSGSQTSTILAEACRAATNLMTDGYYPVYVDSPRGSAGYCAWHSAGTCPNGTTIQFAFFFNLDGDPGCDPQDSSGQHSQGLAALGNVSGHELSEALTDPHLNAWYDSSGAENSDKCAWTFGTPLLTFSNGSEWKIQGNWSNHAYDTSTGYPNSSGQRGCIDGGNYR
jgi:hypothetical protein